MDRTKGEVWVFAEQEEGKLSDVPFELLGKARELAGKLGVKVGAVLMGDGVEPLAGKLIAGGADVVHLVEDPALKVFRNKAYRHSLVELVKECSPQIVIFGATHMGRDLAPSVASALQCGLTADCTDLQIGDYKLTRPLHPWDFPGKSTGVGCHCLLSQPDCLGSNPSFAAYYRWCSW